MDQLRILSIAVLFTFLISISAMAGVADDVARDLKVESGVIIMPTGEEFLVDLDASSGLRTGDLLAVVKPGEKIIHPTTGVVLGTTEELKGILQATRVLNGYSYARPVSVQGNIVKGDTVRRFGSIGASFQDPGKKGRELYEQLRSALPDIEWAPYPEGPGTVAVRGSSPLTFVLDDERLVVRGPAFEELYTYAMDRQTAPRGAAVPAIGAKPGMAAPGAIVHRKRDDAAGLTFPADFEGTVVGVEIGDFNGDGLQEIAVAFPERLEVGRIAGGNYERLQILDFGPGRKVISLDGGRLADDGRFELFLTAVRKDQLSSFIVQYLDGRYQIVQENLPWYFRSVQLPGEGAVLLCQRMGGVDTNFSGSIFRVRRDGRGVVEGDAIPVPTNTNLFGFLPFQSSNGETLFLQFTAADRLRVVRIGGEVLWESGERFGGSEAFIERRDPVKNPADGISERTIFMPARMFIAPGGEIVIPVNDGSRILAGSRNYRNSRLVAMTWNGFALQELWHTLDQAGYLADFRVADANNDGSKAIAQVLVFSKEGFRSKGRSALGLFTLP